jgi:hypothetical protein
MQPSIKDLRRAGYKVRVYHQRMYKSFGKFNEISVLSPKGGKTTIEITTPDKQHNVITEAVCSKEDNFNHKLGNAIAVGRALEKLKVLENITVL